jgi:RNA polymerase sigma factor (sigma-70 family)
MLNGCAHGALSQVARVFHDGTLTGMSDRQVLERFVADRDERAFEALVLRHGPMVFNVCQQILRDQVDAEDAFQAVFVALVEKARTIRVNDSLGPWLYTVATRIARRNRANRKRWAARVASAGDDLAELPTHDDLDRHEIPRVIHEELRRLPRRLQAPVVLCYLEGMTHDFAASELGCPVGTVRSRLAKARGLLRQRVSRRGLTLSIPALALVLESNTRSATISGAARSALMRMASEVVTKTTAASGGFGGYAAIAAVLKGVWHVLRIRRPAIFASAMIFVGALGIIVVSRAFVVGQTSMPPMPSLRQPYDDRPLGPDGRPIGAKGNWGSETFAKTYYVGDLVKANTPSPPNSPTPARGEATEPKPDMVPLVLLITSNVAPGSWQVRNEAGADITAQALGAGSLANRSAGGSRVGSITPFFPSISLIIRCTAETHEQVGNFLTGLLNVIYARDRNSAEKRPTEQKAAADSEATASAADAVRPPTVPKTRIEQLVDELRKQVEKLQK